MNAFKFNDTEILRPVSWSETANVIESVQTTEAGTDVINVTRYDKLSISAEFGCSAPWAKIFREFSQVDTFTLTRYNVISGEDEERTVRMRNYTQTLVKDSETLAGFDGLYSVSFELEEI